MHALAQRSAGAPDTSVSFGGIVERTDIRSSMGPFHLAPDYRTVYPPVVVQALSDLILEYQAAFAPLIERNREWDTDYRLCEAGGTHTHFGIQIDMVGLTQSFLDEMVGKSVAAVRLALRERIFEIENSLAMYQLVEQIFANGTYVPSYSVRFRSLLGKVRRHVKKPIALLAPTADKYAAMLSTEFGITDGRRPSVLEVRETTGFDEFFGPDEFRAYVEAENGECRYALYVRASDPVSKLKDPRVQVHHPLLRDPAMRRLIKANAVTINIDDPDMNAALKINDTKEYAPAMYLGYQVTSEHDIFTPAFMKHLEGGGAYAEFCGDNRLLPAFGFYAEKSGLDPATDTFLIRAKPAKGTYGCYGHHRGCISDRYFRQKLRRSLKMQPGGYLIQPEMPIPVVVDSDTGSSYHCIDRNFFGVVPGQRPHFLGGIRSLMPSDSVEGQKGRNHGSQFTVCAEVTG